MGTRNGHRLGNASLTGPLEREVLWRARLARPVPFRTEADRSRQMRFHGLRAKFFSKFGLASVVDQTIVAVGFTAALASAGFAGIMMTTDHSRPLFGGIEHLMLFAQPLHSRPPAAIAQGQTPSRDDAVDYTATGSIKRKASRLMDGDPAVKLPPEPTEPIIMSYVLQEAQNGVAVVQGRGTAYRVQPGNLLPGAGRVLTVERREDRWVVVTTQGIIVNHISPTGAP